MTVHNLRDRRDRNRAAAEAVYSDIDREIRAARDEIMSRGLSRLGKANRHATLDDAVQRLGQLWVAAWPFDIDPEVAPEPASE